jgi:hypothetical protein
MARPRRQETSIRAELNDAVIGGIRLRGRDAVGLVLIGVASLLLVILSLGVLLIFVALFGIEITATLCAALGGLAAGVSRLPR